MSPAGIDTIPLPGGNLAEAVAGHLLDRHANLLPDLSGLIVLVPNHRAGQDLIRALARQAALSAFVPPQTTPLKVWAETVAGQSFEPQSRRLARLHAVLRREHWLGDVDRWSLATELLQLADELSAADADGLVTGKLGVSASQMFSRETALIVAVWNTLNTDGRDPQARYASALSTLAAQARLPLHGYALGPLTNMEKNFLAAYAGQAPVTLFQTSPGAHAENSLAHILRTAWNPSESSILARGRQLASAYRDSSLLDQTRLYPAPHLEAEACAVAGWVAEQLQAGRNRIALIALDRLTARRVRALLERLDVLVADETGWTLSTTSAAAVIDRWLDCVFRDFPYIELLDLLKSPFLTGGARDQQDAVLQLELAMRQHGVSQGMATIYRLADKHAPRSLPSLEPLFTAARSCPQTRTTLSSWLGRLIESLNRINATASLSADAAGAKLLALIASRQRELADDSEKYNFSEWRRWLNLTLESENFIDESIASPIVMTSLPAARGRSFEAVAILGADAAHLPGAIAAGLFTQATRAELGLPTIAEQAGQTREDLITLMSSGNTLLTWQAWKDDQPNPPSPFITLLQTLHKATWKSGLATQASALPPTTPSLLPAPTLKPAPEIPAERLPRRYSPTAYQTLIDCPYRFFARSVLGLKELDEADEALDKSDYGNTLHGILKRFHDDNPPLARDAALARLKELTEAEFAGLPAYTAAAWRAQWEAIQPAYIDFWLKQQDDGWHYQSSESDFSTDVNVPGLGEVVLHGRIDRIDFKGSARQVIDYKTTRAQTLKKKLKDPGEAVQLPFYAWLANAWAAYLPINDEAPATLTMDEDTDVEAIALRLPTLLEAIGQGSRLPANGVEATCQHCEARGLCRKGMWHD